MSLDSSKLDLINPLSSKEPTALHLHSQLDKTMEDIDAIIFIQKTLIREIPD
jgi:hypothetical protein